MIRYANHLKLMKFFISFFELIVNCKVLELIVNYDFSCVQLDICKTNVKLYVSFQSN